jgi:hypothetical protein
LKQKVMPFRDAIVEHYRGRGAGLCSEQMPMNFAYRNHMTDELRPFSIAHFNRLSPRVVELSVTVTIPAITQTSPPTTQDTGRLMVHRSLVAFREIDDLEPHDESEGVKKTS